MFNYKWNIKDNYPVQGIKKHNTKVFTTFACGGGSSMGYKLAGYDVIAANDIDPQMEKVYLANHHPKYFYKTPIKDLIEMELPEELMGIDILDGSPPCSTFSMSGSRDRVWGKDKMFREGQAKQVLDDLFFDFIMLADKIKPKVIIAENVKGMLLGKAKGYLVEIKKQLNDIGYNVQLFLLNSASMGVPQKRERVFFICTRKDLNLPKIELSFNEKPVTFGEIRTNENTRPVTAPSYRKVWDAREWGEYGCAQTNKRVFNRPNSFFDLSYIYDNKVLNTITAHDHNILFDEPRYLNITELCLAGSFPLDYDFAGLRPEYLIGMSVPPVMMAQVSNQVYKQLISKL